MQWGVDGTDSSGATRSLVVEAASAQEADQQTQMQGVRVNRVYPIVPQAVLPYNAGGSPFALVVANAKWVRIWSIITGVIGWSMVLLATSCFVFSSLTDGAAKPFGIFAGFWCVAGCALFLAAQAGLSLLANLALMAQEMARGGVR